MSSTPNIISESILNTEVKNKGFVILDSIFKENGWILCKNEMNWICYTKFGFETDVFEIRIDDKTIQVGIPVKNSPFKYITKFNNYFLASEYIEDRFKDFIN
jgi:hypothetical protein